MTTASLRQFPWLSIALLTLAYFTFGWFLHESAVPTGVWGLAVAFAIAQAAIWTVFWDSSQRFVLRRIQSDLGYITAVLTTASLAVAVIAWLHVFVYILVMIAAALFVRLDTVVLRFNHLQAFLLLLAIAGVGLGSSWLSSWLISG